MERGELRGSYNPYTKEQWEKIKRGWNLYKSAIGLEGDLFLELKERGLSEGEISEHLDKHRESKQGLVEIYRKEIRRNG
ncbi:hypothetical protein COX03_03125 [Candidatus Woesebacteria bacterium CG22_combo_CG10-13_8_21_14_all_39_10]|uniref:Uncharacterized protein n=2 Tax=Candidatus Woeseibacteriota TaxID=1752722 RepID=A0A2H0BIJ5_9BACT|nr:MAG: hypothetical protein COX03_03125 [Candidatus Woesebacteria bacterium CG22_combo_CG10-13_8_21_14_all_39_10]PIZ47579.1 MAG: hypothetical protein COY29_05000 [Candidatus Woesebacteria bacterium CG_4_10_14_0_2_um_filter_39_14]